jgi:uncharacterized protein (TIGR03492 family)
MRVLIISNGYGEDAMAAILARELKDKCEVEALPTVGAGQAYNGICPIVGPRGDLASEGHRKVGSLVKDFQHGLAFTAVKHIQYMRQYQGRWDKIVTVGDIIGPLLAKAGKAQVDLHIDVYNSGYARHYSWAEKQALKRTVKKILCRDDILAGSLRAIDMDAGFAGNLMMDTVPEIEVDLTSIVEGKNAITLMPGSRDGAAKTFRLQIEALSRFTGRHEVVGLVPIAPSVELISLLKASGLRRVDEDLLGPSHLAVAQTPDETHIHFFNKGVGTLVKSSLFAVGQPGTAIFQSAGLGAPVIALVADDARPQRVARNERLMGASRESCEHDVAQLARKMEMFLSDPEATKKRGKIGIERIGQPGALEAAVRIILG